MTPEERIKELSDFKKSLVEMTEEQLRELAAKLIEDCGYKGFKSGGAMVSEKHSGFVINYDKVKR